MTMVGMIIYIQCMVHTINPWKCVVFVYFHDRTRSPILYDWSNTVLQNGGPCSAGCISSGKIKVLFNHYSLIKKHWECFSAWTTFKRSKFPNSNILPDFKAMYSFNLCRFYLWHRTLRSNTVNLLLLNIPIFMHLKCMTNKLKQQLGNLKPRL